MNKQPAWLWALGGRKQTNGYFAAALLTGMAFYIRPTFTEYATAVIIALGIHTGAVAWEDYQKMLTGGAAAPPQAAEPQG